MELRQYQINIIDSVKRMFLDGHKRVILCLPTGGGKTVIFSNIAKRTAAKGKRVLIATHRVEIFSQTDTTFSDMGVEPELVFAGMKSIDLSKNVYIAMIETIMRRSTVLNSINPDLIITDECFVPGTKVSGVNIESLKVGDLVESFNHSSGKVELKQVTGISKKITASDLLLIRFSYAQFVCTQDHPIFVVDKGYVPAKFIQENDVVYGYNMFTLQGAVKERKLLQKIIKNSRIEYIGWKKKQLLQSKMRCFRTCKRLFRKDEKEQSDVKERDPRKGIGNAEENWAQANSSRRKRERHVCPAKGPFERIRRIVVPGVDCANWSEYISSNPLQSRHRRSGKENSNRSRWAVSCFKTISGTRCKKRLIPSKQRVQSVEIYKQKDRFRHEGGFDGDYVYNIEVADNNNYFANGILVHNCHMGSFTKLMNVFPDTLTIGVTATPIGKHIPKYFTNIVQNIDVQDLIAQGFLVRCRAYQMQDDFSDLVARAGEFTEESQMDHFDKKTLYDGVIREWLTKNPEPTSWAKTICFNVNIAHTEKMHDAWLQEGIPSGIITSKTSKQDRIQVLQDFKDGKITVLNNCGVLTTGFDEPSIQCVIVNRATMSLALWLQMVGRGSRTFANKTEFLLLDFGMNHKRHGLWSQPRKWSLDMKERKVSDKLDAAPVKTCDNCGAMVPIMAKECEFCLNVFDMANKRLRNGVLVEVLPNPIEGKLLSQLTLEEISDLQDLKKLGFGASYLWRVVRSRGAADILLYGRLRKYSSGWTGRQIEQMSDCAYKDKVVILPED